MKKISVLLCEDKQKIKFLGDVGHIHKPLMYYGILRKVNLSFIERVNYVEEMLLKVSQKLRDLK